MNRDEQLKYFILGSITDLNIQRLKGTFEPNNYLGMWRDKIKFRLMSLQISAEIVIVIVNKGYELDQHKRKKGYVKESYGDFYPFIM